MRNGSSNASIDGHKGPTLDWRAENCSVDMVSPKTTHTDAIWRPIKAIGMVDTRSVLSIRRYGYSCVHSNYHGRFTVVTRMSCAHHASMVRTSTVHIICTRKFSKTQFMHRARAARPRGFDSLPSLDPDRGRCQVLCHVNSDFVKQ
jgi:hypothetical protein